MEARYGGPATDGADQSLGGRPDRLVCLALTREALRAHVGAAQEQEHHEAREGDDQDEDQPRHGRGGLPVAGQHPDRQELDDVVGDDEGSSENDDDGVH